jgi:3-methylfumaryl-CoA hydratase
MFAGGRMWFNEEVPIGAALTRRGRVRSAVEKSGRSGPFLLVTLAFEIELDGRVAIREEQDLVYLPAERSSEANPPSTGTDSTRLAERWAWEAELPTDPAVLFRFSALTYNAHRIHYDDPYAREVEGYPGLVVHGPLQAVALAELSRRHAPDHRPTSFAFRAIRPAFVGEAVRLRGRPTGTDVELMAFDAAGATTVQASMSLERKGTA